MAIIKLKRVYEDYEDSDGYRVLVDRLWPRGVKKEHLHYDLWAKDITPSAGLRIFFHNNPEENWDLFKHKYEEELENSASISLFVEKIKDYPVVTFLYASKDPIHNHAMILKKFLEFKLHLIENQKQ